MPAWASSGVPDARAASVTLKLGVPAGLQVGDYLQAGITSGAPITITPPNAGWTLVAGIQNSASADFQVWDKTADAGDVGAATLDFQIAGNANSAGCVHRFTGQQASSPRSVAATTNTHAASVNQVAPSITPAHPDCLLVCYWAAGGGDVTYTAPASMTKRFDMTGLGAARDYAMATEQIVGGSGVPTGTRTATSPSQVGREITVAIRPAGNIFTVGLAGSATPGGAVAAKAKKVVGSTSTPTGTLAQKTFKLVGNAVLTPAGVVGKRTAKFTRIGQVAPTGAQMQKPKKLLAGAATPTGAVASRAVKLLAIAGTTTPAGDLRKKLARALAGLVTPAGSVAQRLVAIIRLAGEVAPTTMRNVVEHLTSQERFFEGAGTGRWGGLYNATLTLSAGGFEGSQAAKLEIVTGGASAWTRISNVLPGAPVPGKRYEFSGWLKRSSADKGFQLWLRVWSGANYVNYNALGLATTNWQRQATSYKATGGETSIDLFVIGPGTSWDAGDAVLFDAMSFRSGGAGPILKIFKPLGGTATPAGQVMWRRLSQLGGMVTPIGSVFRRIARGFSSSTTPAGRLWRFAKQVFWWYQPMDAILDASETDAILDPSLTGTAFDGSETGLDFEP